MFVSLILVYLLIMNAAGFLIMLVDKQKAIHKKWRIPEATLMTVAALGGSIGSLLGMYTFHHKVRKPRFYVGIPLILFVQIFLAVFLFSRL